ncbi:hypothetical protein CBW65_03940 [Tumebacillus avium]|uniref:Uncharacterized protein n=1 Tax=Tumebacillus avium TaxID=1903704 RepID=A0A1Y0IIM7_9BACL|nr:hypothetical protein [Tumebacillus avium]ARU60308.1 hypothetical protein CBW65_03940 [Tumebacillus avium]
MKHLLRVPLPIYVLLLLAVLVTVSYFFMQTSASRALNEQLQDVLQKRELIEIANLALDDKTKDFLLHLPADVKVKSDLTTDQQGGLVVEGQEIIYLNTRIEDQTVHAYLIGERTTLWQRMIPDWKLFKLAIDHTVQLPDLLKDK